MTNAIFRGMTALTLTAVLAGCQAFPAVQQDVAAIGSGISARVPQPSGATSMPGIPGLAPPAGSGSAATGQSVTDPYAGQGVANPNVPASSQVKATSTDPEVRRLLGVDDAGSKGLGLDPAWAYNVIKQVGNYGEVFERNVGMGSPMKLERGLNASYTKGGLIYAPPL